MTTTSLAKTFTFATTHDISCDVLVMSDRAVMCAAEVYTGRKPRKIHQLGIMYTGGRCVGYCLWRNAGSPVLLGPVLHLSRTTSGMLVLKTVKSIWVGECGDILIPNPADNPCSQLTLSMISACSVN